MITSAGAIPAQTYRTWFVQSLLLRADGAQAELWIMGAERFLGTRIVEACIHRVDRSCLNELRPMPGQTSKIVRADDQTPGRFHPYIDFL